MERTKLIERLHSDELSWTLYESKIEEIADFTLRILSEQKKEIESEIKGKFVERKAVVKLRDDIKKEIDSKECLHDSVEHNLPMVVYEEPSIIKDLPEIKKEILRCATYIETLREILTKLNEILGEGE